MDKITIEKVNQKYEDINTHIVIEIEYSSRI